MFFLSKRELLHWMYSVKYARLLMFPWGFLWGFCCYFVLISNLKYNWSYNYVNGVVNLVSFVSLMKFYVFPSLRTLFGFWWRFCWHFVYTLPWIGDVCFFSEILWLTTNLWSFRTLMKIWFPFLIILTIISINYLSYLLLYVICFEEFDVMHFFIEIRCLETD